MSDDFESVLPVGSYGALEGDVGEPLRPLAGFGREVEPVEEEVPSVSGVSTSSGVVRYISPDQLETWASAEWASGGFDDAA